MGNNKFNENTRYKFRQHSIYASWDILIWINLCLWHKDKYLDWRFLKAVKRLNPGLSGSEASLLYAKIVNIANNDDLGREFYQLLSANSGTKLIDFENKYMRNDIGKAIDEA